MSEPFLAEIRIFPGTFAPSGWAFCNGQLLPIAQNTAIFSLLGTTYGGNGSTTFALPDFQGRAPIMWGHGIGLSPRFQGETGGAPAVALISSELPFHTHTVQARGSLGNQQSPEGNTWSGSQLRPFHPTPTTNMSDQAVSVSGGSLPHDNMPPFLALNFIIALQGLFPPRP